MLHTNLPIYKKGYDLLTLAADVQLNMPRTFKQSLGKRVHDECVDLLLEIGYANASRGEQRCDHIRNVLRGLEVVSLMMRVSFDKRFISHKTWATSMELTGTIGDQAILRDLIAARVTEPFWLKLAETIIFHDPRLDFEYRGDEAMLDLVPAHKRLTNQPAHLGLPIGNLSSQFFANVYLDVLDQFVKHGLRARHYIRYVDDFVLLHESAQWLNEALASINEFLPAKLHARLNPTKTILQPVDRGIDFVGQVIKPWRRVTRRRTFNDAIRRVRTIAADDLFETANSYYGLLRQASHSHQDRALLSNELRRRGHAIAGNLTKTYRSKH